ncbi:ATP-binding cassette domain-containing protein [Fusobacterium necrophorum]|uniref:ABC transporter n=1 Tax=Fusobacterium necrophorum DJ-2 TaxID=1441737 RepID=A0AB73C1R7_9FUSO|nr:ATP-binding cassette domain-containing protein [Fusobacterium necrophorum]KDE65256.1 ABC transporter [Fusobacterium necrophorum DJ-1]KDE71114.1 ABC transporter [Fusobacterium necrophorum DJ-2]
MNHWTDLHCKYGEETIFENLQLDWQEGEQIGFWGCSGCGKTSLLKEIARRLEAEGKKFSYIFQNEVLIDCLTVEENIKLVGTGLEKREQEEILSLFKLEEHLLKFPTELSGGLRKRAALARAFFYQGEYLLLDEAFEFLDLALQETILEYIEREQKKKRRTIFLVTHRVEIMLRLAEKIFVFPQEKRIQYLECYENKEKKKTKKILEDRLCRT